MSAADEPAHDPAVFELATKAFELARQGQTDTLSAYVDAGVPAGLRDDDGDTLVMLAAVHGHADTVGALLRRGADADEVGALGATPLAAAVRSGADEVVRVLLRHGADPQAGSPSAVAAARAAGRTELLELFGRV
ncbi:ankyrin repeat domain-containing protein [Streptomyces synnematoformans]|uniref:Ankyrin repeat domain-containing protein n=1 Tax=Streptomyces synnematoformans TaxID=415721 RepID=A0ABN2XKG0_9ACTN